jgi:PhnB protein
MYSVHKVEVILTVPSVEETSAWYERVLGWTAHYDTFDAEGRCNFGSVMLGDVESVIRGEKPFTGFNLSRFQGEARSCRNEGSNLTLLIGVDNVDAIYARVVGSGVHPDSAPENQPWGGRTFSIRDPNGFDLTFFQQVEQVSIEEIRRRYEQASE